MVRGWCFSEICGMRLIYIRSVHLIGLCNGKPTVYSKNTIICTLVHFLFINGIGQVNALALDELCILLSTVNVIIISKIFIFKHFTVGI